MAVGATAVALSVLMLAVAPPPSAVAAVAEAELAAMAEAEVAAVVASEVAEVPEEAAVPEAAVPEAAEIAERRSRCAL